MKAYDSAGGVIECVIDGVPAGLGDPVFEKLDANLAKAVMSIGAVEAVEIGDGIEVSRHHGSTNNDPFRMEDGRIIKSSNHAGGILGEEIEIAIKGRHDPVIVPRAVVVVESMAAITILDALLVNASCKMDNLKKLYLL